MKDSRLRASLRLGGQGVFFNFLFTDPLRGRPVLGWRQLSYLMVRGVTIPAFYLNTTIFMGNVQKKLEHSTGVSTCRCGSQKMRSPPNGYYVIIALSAGAAGGGQARSPPSSYVHVMVHSRAKALLQGHNLLRLLTPCTPHQYRENPVEHHSFQVYMHVDRSFILFRFRVLPEHDDQGDYRYHHDRTRCEEQVDCGRLVYLFQFRRILLYLPGSDGNVGGSICILVQG